MDIKNFKFLQFNQKIKKETIKDADVLKPGVVNISERDLLLSVRGGYSETFKYPVKVTSLSFIHGGGHPDRPKI